MKIIQFFPLIFLPLKFATADVVQGRCPQVTGTPFYCLRVKHKLSDTDNGLMNLLIYGFLPSSPDSKSLNIFGFDFPRNVSISNYFVKISCDSINSLMNFFWIKCGVNLKFYQQTGENG